MLSRCCGRNQIAIVCFPPVGQRLMRIVAPTVIVAAVAALAFGTLQPHDPNGPLDTLGDGYRASHTDAQTDTRRACADARTSSDRAVCLEKVTKALEQRVMPDVGDRDSLNRIRSAGKHKRGSLNAGSALTLVPRAQAPNVALASQLINANVRRVSYNPSGPTVSASVPVGINVGVSVSSVPKQYAAQYAMATIRSIWPFGEDDPLVVSDSKPTDDADANVDAFEGPPIPDAAEPTAGSAGTSVDPETDGATQVPDTNPDPDKLGPITAVAPVQRIGETGAVVLPTTVDHVPAPPTTVVLPAPPVALTVTVRPSLGDLDPDMRTMPTLSASRRRTMAPVIRRASAYQMALNAAISKACGPGVLSPENSFVSTLAGQIYQESNFNVRAQSAVGAQGMTQMMPDTAAGLARQYPGLRPPRPWDPFWSIEAQAHLMCDNYRLYAKGRSACSAGLFALSAYNGGPRALDREILLCRGRTPDWLAQPALKQTRPVTDNSCIATRWFDHVGDMRSRSVAAYVENREYAIRILGHQIYFMEAGWGGGWCHSPN